jgi:CO dehydrogenase/acetyl-CoA synthase beta subunit
MKFVITRTSSDNYVGVKDFSTVEELVNFMRKQKHPLIIGSNFAFNEDIEMIQEGCSRDVDAREVVAIPYSIEIYDDYRE